MIPEHLLADIKTSQACDAIVASFKKRLVAAQTKMAKLKIKIDKLKNADTSAAIESQQMQVLKAQLENGISDSTDGQAKDQLLSAHMSLTHRISIMQKRAKKSDPVKLLETQFKFNSTQIEEQSCKEYLQALDKRRAELLALEEGS